MTRRQEKICPWQPSICPTRCSYCRYGHLRRKTTFLDAAEVSKRVRILMDRGAKEIRFVDPVFNANPAFQEILASLLSLNRKGRLKFFAEVQADPLTPEQIHGLAEAGFSELEEGDLFRAEHALAIRSPAEP
jgi:radical SAM superfamily enzyme YgiQ (UPF0313 family)